MNGGSSYTKDEGSREHPYGPARCGHVQSTHPHVGHGTVEGHRRRRGAVIVASPDGAGEPQGTGTLVDRPARQIIDAAAKADVVG